MKILINCSNLKVGGGLQVAHSFLNHIKNNSIHTFVVVLSKELRSQINKDEFCDNFKFFDYNISTSPLKALFGKDKFLNKLVKTEGIEKVLSIFGPTYWKPSVLHVAGYAKPHYVYKDSPFFKTLSLVELLKLKLKEFFHMQDFKRNNAVIITENGDVSERLKAILKFKKVYTVTNYYNQVFDNRNEWSHDLDLSAFKGCTLLTISANYPHKNLVIIKNVIENLNIYYPDFEYRFVLTLDNSEIFQHANDDILKRLVFLGKVNISQCPLLYERSDLVFLPTLLECFTATYAESMRMRKPILTSDLNFARGLCSEAAVYFDPLDPKEIADKIFFLATNRGERDVLIDNGIKQLLKFDNYSTRAKKYLEIIVNETNHPIL